MKIKDFKKFIVYECICETFSKNRKFKKFWWLRDKLIFAKITEATEKITFEVISREVFQRNANVIWGVNKIIH